MTKNNHLKELHPIPAVAENGLELRNDLEARQEHAHDNRVTVTATENIGAAMLGILALVLLIALLRAQSRIQVLMEQRR